LRPWPHVSLNATDLHLKTIHGYNFATCEN